MNLYKTKSGNLNIFSSNVNQHSVSDQAFQLSNMK